VSGKDGIEYEQLLFFPFFPLLPERQWQLSGEDQKGGRWKVSKSGRKTEKRETVPREGTTPVSNSSGALPTALQFPSTDEK